MNKRLLPYLLLAVLAIAILLVKTFKPQTAKTLSKVEQRNDGSNYAKSRGLNRHAAYINYTKHAICRMDCRKITEQEIKQVLQKGNINYTKSELKGADCNKKYAVDGYSNDGQHIRIVVAPCNDELTLITCIDLDKDWSCDCK